MNRNNSAEPMEQIDYGLGYKGILSPQQHVTFNIQGGTAVVLLATIIAALLLAGVSLGIAMSAKDLARIAEREGRVAQDKYFYVASQLSKLDPSFKTDEH